jgi:hypothetical protein
LSAYSQRRWEKDSRFFEGNLDDKNDHDNHNDDDDDDCLDHNDRLIQLHAVREVQASP